MFRKIFASNLDKRFFHEAEDTAFSDKLDDIVFGKPDGEVKRFVYDEETDSMKEILVPKRPGSTYDFSTYCFAVGTCKSGKNYPQEGILSHFRTSGERWCYGDYFPSSPGWTFAHSPFAPDDEVLVVAMGMTHDGVCDEPVVSTLFLEGEMAGDVENIFVIMLYDHCSNEIFRELDEAGVLFLYDDAGSLSDDDFAPYFPQHSLHTHHGGETAGDLVLDCALPIPLLEHFDAAEVTAAKALTYIFAKLDGLEEEVVGWMPLTESLEMLEDGLCFEDDLPTEEELDIEEKERWEEQLRQRRLATPKPAAGNEDRKKPTGVRKRPSESDRSEWELERAQRQLEEQRKQREGRLLNRRRRALVKLLMNVEPLADSSKLLFHQYEFRNSKYPDIWESALSAYPIQLSFGMRALLGSSPTIRFSLHLQALGRLLGLDGDYSQYLPEEKLKVLKKTGRNLVPLSKMALSPRIRRHIEWQERAVQECEEDSVGYENRNAEPTSENDLHREE